MQRFILNKHSRVYTKVRFTQLVSTKQYFTRDRGHEEIRNIPNSHNIDIKFNSYKSLKI